MQAPTDVRWIEGGSHGLAVKGRPEEVVLEEVNTHITKWIQQHLSDWHQHTSQSRHGKSSLIEIKQQRQVLDRQNINMLFTELMLQHVQVFHFRAHIN